MLRRTASLAIHAFSPTQMPLLTLAPCPSFVLALKLPIVFQGCAIILHLWHLTVKVIPGGMSKDSYYAEAAAGGCESAS